MLSVSFSQSIFQQVASSQFSSSLYIFPECAIENGTEQSSDYVDDAFLVNIDVAM